MLTPTPPPGSEPGSPLTLLEVIFGLIALISTPLALWYDKFRNRRKPDADLHTQEIDNDAKQVAITKATLEAANQAILNYNVVLLRLSALEDMSTKNTIEIRQLKDDKFRLEREAAVKDQLIITLQARVKKLEDTLEANDVKIPNGI